MGLTFSIGTDRPAVAFDRPTFWICACLRYWKDLFLAYDWDSWTWSTATVPPVDEEEGEVKVRDEIPTFCQHFVINKVYPISREDARTARHSAHLRRIRETKSSQNSETESSSSSAQFNAMISPNNIMLNVNEPPYKLRIFLSPPFLYRIPESLIPSVRNFSASLSLQFYLGHIVRPVAATTTTDNIVSSFLWNHGIMITGQRGGGEYGPLKPPPNDTRRRTREGKVT